MTSQTAPTCTTAGSNGYQCSMCEKTGSEVVPATGVHTYALQSTAPATCAAPGANHFACTMCGGGYEEAIPATGVHTYAVVSQNQNITYQCSGCGATYSEANPNWVSWREATAEEKARCLAAINAERAKLGYVALTMRHDLGAQAWANHLASTKTCDHYIGMDIYWGGEGVGVGLTPERCGVAQCYDCLGLAINKGSGIGNGTGDDFAANPTIEIGIAVNNETGSYYYCFRTP